MTATMNATITATTTVKMILLIGLLIIAQAPSAFASCGTFEVSKGDVKVQSTSGAVAAAPVGAKICSGETVIAADQARAKIHMEDGNELNISPNSKIVIETYQFDAGANKKKVLLNVLKGKVRATTVRENMYNDKATDGQANTFQVRTKSAVAGVRGTDFLTGFDPATSKTEVITFRGKVEVGLPGPAGTIMSSVQVSVGQKTEVIGGRAPAPPKDIPAGDLNKANNESRGSASTSATTPNKSASSSTAAPAPESDRQPASVGPAPATSGAGSMITYNDMPATTTAPPIMPPLPTMPMMPAVMATPPPLPQSVQDALTRSNVTVHLRIGN